MEKTTHTESEPQVRCEDGLGDSALTDERLYEIEVRCADLNLKMWDGSRGVIEELCRELRKLRSQSVLTEVHQWLQEGPMDDWDKRCSLHRRIGDMLGKQRTTYGE